MNRSGVFLLAALIAASVAATGSQARSLDSTAQLQREHARAIATNDPANDPDNPASSNALNLKQLHRARALGDGPAPLHRRHAHHHM